jgi:hypothetical protein
VSKQNSASRHGVAVAARLSSLARQREGCRNKITVGPLRALGGMGRPEFPSHSKAPRLSAGGCERGAFNSCALISKGRPTLFYDWLLAATWMLLTAGAALCYFPPLARLLGA